jgi:hypothetical protein
MVSFGGEVVSREGRGEVNNDITLSKYNSENPLKIKDCDSKLDYEYLKMLELLVVAN